MSKTKFITQREAAALLHCSVDKIRLLGKKGIITPLREYGKLRYDEDQVRDYHVEQISDPVHLTERAAAKMLNVSRAYVRELCYRKILRTTKVFGVKHVLKTSVEEVIVVRAEQKAEKKEDRKTLKEMLSHYREGIKHARLHKTRGLHGKFAKAKARPVADAYMPAPASISAPAAAAAPAPAPVRRYEPSLEEALMERGIDPNPQTLDEAIALRKAIDAARAPYREPVQNIQSSPRRGGWIRWLSVRGI